ncbi:Vps53-like protein [Gaertneriomyces semiglobifer]|nr:Vps53-like protein [Gaertneriomyces semiglobifer]
MSETGGLLQSGSPTLSPELDHAISSILSTSDPLDSRDFDPIEYINRMFLSEESLSTAEAILAKLCKRIQAMNKEMRDLVKGQIDAGSRGREEVEATQAAIQELFNNIKRIKEQAADSERMVQEITRDIKSLDHAKKNLTSSVVILRRLQMIVSAVDQLRNLSSRKQYLETAQLVQVINQLQSHFKTYRSVQQIAALLDSISQLQSDIRRQIFRDFEAGFVGGALRSHISLLSDACMVINVLEGDAKKALIDWYTDIQLKDYRSIFRNNPEVAGLADVSRRYAWLKRLLKSFDEDHAVVFPPEWSVAQLLCIRFCQDTSRDLSEVLAKSDANMDVKIMIQALQSTLDFESKLFKRFGSRDYAAAGLSKDNTPPPKGSPFHRVISGAFEPFLHHYIRTEEQTLKETIEQYRTRPIDTEGDVLSSSTDLFYIYRNMMVQCAPLSTGKPFLDLTRAFAGGLRSYGDVIKGKLPKEDKKTLSEEDIRIICLCIGTAEYCSGTTAQLEDKLSEKIDEEFRPLINYTKERDQFIDIGTQATRTLINLLLSHIDPAFQLMLKRQWAHLDSVGDQSEYVTVAARHINWAFAEIRKTLGGAKWWKIVCDKFAEAFMNKFYGNVWKCKPVSEIGAEQLLLDTQALRTVFIEVGKMGDGPIPTTFTKLLTKLTMRLDQLLKVVLRPVSPVEGIIETYFLLYGEKERNVDSLRGILDLKGVKRNDQLLILEAFKKRVGITSDLALTTGTTPFPPESAMPVNTPLAYAEGSNKFETGFKKFVAGMSIGGAARRT